jgi:hypothetical protein
MLRLGIVSWQSSEVEGKRRTFDEELLAISEELCSSLSNCGNSSGIMNKDVCYECNAKKESEHFAPNANACI